jgi:phosphoserine phosphatase RsbU/P
MSPTDYSVFEEGNVVTTDVDRDAFVERVLDDPLIEICLDDLNRNERGDLESDLALAARIQKTLLPARDFSPSGWQVHYHYAPAGLLSGDYCDLFESDGNLSFLLGDVAGKGVAASMLVSHLHAIFRSLAAGDPPLDLMVEAANRVFSQSTLAGQFATLVVGRAARDGSVEFVSAGHPPLLHLAKGRVSSEPATGVPLGVFTDVQFPVRRFSTGPGDTLLIYSDGLTESRSPIGEEYGIDRLRGIAARHATATPSKLISECLSDLLDFTNGKKQNDDLTLLAIQRST